MKKLLLTGLIMLATAGICFAGTNASSSNPSNAITISKIKYTVTNKSKYTVKVSFRSEKGSQVTAYVRNDHKSHIITDTAPMSIMSVPSPYYTTVLIPVIVESTEYNETECYSVEGRVVLDNDGGVVLKGTNDDHIAGSHLFLLDGPHIAYNKTNNEIDVSLDIRNYL